MDDSQQATTVISQTQKNSLFNLKKYLIFIIFLILGFILGFGTRYLTSSQKIVSMTPIFDESKLAVSLSLLTNPIVYQWSGSVKGKIIEKDDHVFTLVDDKNNKITITDKLATGETFKTLFYDRIADKSKPASQSAIPLSKMPLESTVSGYFFIFKNSPNRPIGGMFTRQ